MPTANPLEQLRRRMQSHASPAAFAAAAEEHRRAGRFAEAIAVCRDGLDRYPAYASARATLGRALLDSGDAAAAVAELEQAVAQAPDNLAASRALEAARAALGDLAEAAAPADPVGHLPLQGPVTGPAADDVDAWHLGASGDASAGNPPAFENTSPAIDEALDMAADGPQEFGLGPDWLPTGPGFGPDPHVPPLPIEVAGLPAFTDTLTPPQGDGPLQGDEPAGIWPAPLLDGDDAGTPSGAPAYSWALDVAGSTEAQEPPAPTSSIWDEPTIAAPFPIEMAQGEPSLDASVAAAASGDVSADPGGNGQWTGLFVEPVHDGAAPAVFSGWEASGPGSRDVPTWSEAPAAEPVTSAFTVPGLWGNGPEAAEDRATEWQSVEAPLPPASHTPEWPVPEPAIDASAATPEAMGEWTMVTTAPAVPVCADTDGGEAQIEAPALTSDAAVADVPAAPTQAPSMWDGSVALALDEVFARAGHDAPLPQASLEPPMHPNPAVRDAMADTAVEATLEDVAQQSEALPPALLALQQMLDAVRARRAALHADMEH
jgi:hypothetical protein